MDISTGSFSGKTNSPAVGLTKFATGLGFGTLSERYGLRFGPNAATDFSLKLLNETYNNVIVNGPVEKF